MTALFFCQELHTRFQLHILDKTKPHSKCMTHDTLIHHEKVDQLNKKKTKQTNKQKTLSLSTLIFSLK